MYPVKLSETTDYEYQWIAAAGGYGKRTGHEAVLQDRREELVVWGMVTDDNACYSYDDWALVELDGVFYLLNTSGCSCPDPSDTWELACEPGTLQSQYDHLTGGTYQGWTVPGSQLKDMREMFARAAEVKCIDVDLSKEVPA